MTQQTDGNDQAFATQDFYHENYRTSFGKPGLSKREYFAAMAMQGISAKGLFAELEYSDLAEWSVKQADALIEALNKQK